MGSFESTASSESFRTRHDGATRVIARNHSLSRLIGHGHWEKQTRSREGVDGLQKTRSKTHPMRYLPLRRSFSILVAAPKRVNETMGRGIRRLASMPPMHATLAPAYASGRDDERSSGCVMRKKPTQKSGIAMPKPINEKINHLRRGAVDCAACSPQPSPRKSAPNA